MPFQQVWFWFSLALISTNSLRLIHQQEYNIFFFFLDQNANLAFHIADKTYSKRIFNKFASIFVWILNPNLIMNASQQENSQARLVFVHLLHVFMNKFFVFVSSAHGIISDTEIMAGRIGRTNNKQNTEEKCLAKINVCVLEHRKCDRMKWTKQIFWCIYFRRFVAGNWYSEKVNLCSSIEVRPSQSLFDLILVLRAEEGR